jgi:hypothetical protein
MSDQVPERDLMRDNSQYISVIQKFLQHPNLKVDTVMSFQNPHDQEEYKTQVNALAYADVLEKNAPLPVGDFCMALGFSWAYSNFERLAMVHMLPHQLKAITTSGINSTTAPNLHVFYDHKTLLRRCEAMPIETLHEFVLVRYVKIGFEDYEQEARPADFKCQVCGVTECEETEDVMDHNVCDYLPLMLVQFHFIPPN